MEDKSKRRARLFTILGLVLALIAGLGTYLYTSQSQTAGPPPVQTAPVVVATRDLLPRQAIAAADVTIAQYPVDLIPPGAVSNPENAIGKVLIAPVGKGEPVTPLRWSVQQGQSTFTVLPAGVELTSATPNFRAISISVPEANAVGGNLVPGDVVDIIATVNLNPTTFFLPAPPALPDPLHVADFSTKVILEGVDILAKAGSIYTIRVPDLDTAERLVYLQASGGSLVLLLRAPKDERIISTDGKNFPRIYQEFKFPTTTRIPF